MPLNRRMDKENVVIYTMEYYSAEKKTNNTLKFAGKWMELKKNHPELGSPDPERQI